MNPIRYNPIDGLLSLKAEQTSNVDIFDVISCKTKVKIDDIPFSDGICKSLNEMRLKGVL